MVLEVILEFTVLGTTIPGRERTIGYVDNILYINAMRQDGSLTAKPAGWTDTLRGVSRYLEMTRRETLPSTLSNYSRLVRCHFPVGY